VLHGGHQERGRRGGTENVVGIVGMGKAFYLLTKNMAAEAAEVRRLRDAFEQALFARIPDIVLNGHPTLRLPNTVNLSFRFVEGEALLLNLDMLGIACSSGSACTSGSLEGSPILLAMGADPTDSQGALRFSLGLGNTDDDVAYAVDAIETVVNKLRAMSPLYNPGRRNVPQKYDNGLRRLGGRGSVRGSPCDAPARLRFTSLRPPPAAATYSFMRIVSRFGR